MPSYVEAVLKESMRKYPTAANGSTRLVREGGFNLKKGDDDTDEEELLIIPKNIWLVVDIYSLHNCKHNWGENASEFRPERWLEKNTTEDELSEVSGEDEEESKRERNPLTSLSAYGGIGKSSEDLSFAPFSYGPRNCLGMNLSLLEIRSAIMTMCLRYSFELADKRMLDDSKALETYLTMRPCNKLPMLLTRRD